jgi:predicted N-acyltransferase
MEEQRVSGSVDYRMRVADDLGSVPASKWNALVAAAWHRGGADAVPVRQDGAAPQPFLRHEFLQAMALTGCTGEAAGWIPRHLLLEDGAGELRAIVPQYLKTHSYGEYVFDWAWADAYQRHGLRYYPKLLSAVPFTPVSGPRLIAADGAARAAAAQAVLAMARDSGLSSLHVLFPPADEARLLEQAGAMLRRGVQFHWRNRDWGDFEAFLADLAQPKRKKIRAERRKVAETGLRIERRHGRDIRERDWAFFSRCYENTYAAHGSTPYLNRAFFERIGETMPENLVMVIAHDGARPIATSLLVVDGERVYGRYWGAIAQVPCLHFELCYYQAIELAIESRRAVIEGGAQGEHKMARGFDAVATCSAHWLAEPAFAEAVDRYLAREGGMISAYLGELDERSPFRGPPAAGGDQRNER